MESKGVIVDTMISPYVVLHHVVRSRGTESHFDWMFQSGGVLLTWATISHLSTDLPGDTDAVRLPDHRLEYLDYQGDVSRDRGHVTRVERGLYRIIEKSPHRFEIKVTGDREGKLVFVLETESWLLRFKCP